MDSRLRICVFCTRALTRAIPGRISSRSLSRPHERLSIDTPHPSSTRTLSTKPRSLEQNTPSSKWRSTRVNSIQQQRRSLSITHAYQQTAVQNPREDDDGNEMVVEITPRASGRLKQIMTNDANPDLALRITVESGGCHGFQYLMSLTNMSKVSPEEDTVFQAQDGARIVLDEPSLELLKGSKVDYTMELIGSQFKIVDNPHASSSCGCGTSFDIKV